MAFISGYYGSPPKWRSWVFQVFIWLILVLISKMLILLTIALFHQTLVNAGELLLSPVKGHPKLELLSVMIVIPVLLNSLMFWVTDSFIRNSTAGGNSVGGMELREELTDDLGITEELVISGA